MSIDGVGRGGASPVGPSDATEAVGDAPGTDAPAVQHDHQQAATERQRTFHSSAFGEAAGRARIEALLGDDAGAGEVTRVSADTDELRAHAGACADAAERRVLRHPAGCDRAYAQAILDQLDLRAGLERVADNRPGSPQSTHWDGIEPPELGEQMAEALNREFGSRQHGAPLEATFEGGRLTVSSHAEGAGRMESFGA